MARPCTSSARSRCDLVDISDIVKDPLAVIHDVEPLVPRERIAIEYTRAAMTDSNHIPAALSDELSQHFSDPELVELTFLIGFINMLNLFNNCLQVRYNGEYSVFKEPVA